MPRTIELKDNQCAIVITHNIEGAPVKGVVQAISGKVGLLESVEVVSRNPFTIYGMRAYSKGKDGKRRYYETNTASMYGAVKLAVYTIATWWHGVCKREWLEHERQRTTE